MTRRRSPVANATPADREAMKREVCRLIDDVGAGEGPNWRDTSPEYWVGVEEGSWAVEGRFRELRDKLERLLNESRDP